jgi:hypothetical protein
MRRIRTVFPGSLTGRGCTQNGSGIPVPHLCEPVAFAVAWPVAELSAIPLAANGIKSVQTNAADVTLVDQTG